MEKALIHYFSGTGNSLLAAKQLSQELQKYGYDIAFHAVENGYLDKTIAYSLHIFFFPVYATAMPHIMSKYVRNLPDGKNVKAVVISTNGKISTKVRDGYQGWALHQARLYLTFKNYQVFLSETLDYPHNITIGIPPRKEKYNKKIITQASVKFPWLGKKIAKGQKFHRKFFLPNIIWSLPLGVLYSFFGRRIIGKLFVADSSCNSCGICVKNCPVGAIKKVSKKIRWKWSCEGCLRCMNICPKHAIQASGIRYLAIIGIIFLNPILLIRRLMPGSFIKTFGNVSSTILDTLLSITLFLILDWLIYKISYTPIFKNIANWGFTRYFGRYRAEQYEGLFLRRKHKP